VTVAAAGVQTPRIMWLPDYRSSAGQETVELCEMAGLNLDPWQRLVIEHALGEGRDGRWAAAEVGLCVPRQNGKNAVLEARELAALFLLGEQLVIHSAQQFNTAKEHFLRLLALIEQTPEFDRRVQKVTHTHGAEGIKLVNGQRILFLARNKSAGRGFSAPLVIFDEAMFLAEATMGALLPTQAAMPNRQRWYAGSAVDQQIHVDGLVFARVRDRAVKQTDPRLAYFEWSVDCEQPGMLDQDAASDPAAWDTSNPGLGIRIMQEAVQDELRTLDSRTFAVERLGVGDWPDPSGTADMPIDPAAWAALADPSSELVHQLCFAFDVSPDRSRSSIAAGGRRDDGLYHVEIIRRDPGTSWVVDELARLNERWRPRKIVCDAVGPAAALLNDCHKARLNVTPVTVSEHVRACGLLVDLVKNDQLRHLGSHELNNAVRGATRRQLGDAWAWSRRNSTIDISPLVAATLAVAAAHRPPPMPAVA
jgi:hypothetical protein